MAPRERRRSRQSSQESEVAAEGRSSANSQTDTAQPARNRVGRPRKQVVLNETTIATRNQRQSRKIVQDRLTDEKRQTKAMPYTSEFSNPIEVI